MIAKAILSYAKNILYVTFKLNLEWFTLNDLKFPGWDYRHGSPVSIVVAKEQNLVEENQKSYTLANTLSDFVSLFSLDWIIRWQCIGLLKIGSQVQVVLYGN